MKLLPIIIIAVFTVSLGDALLTRGMKQVADLMTNFDMAQASGLTSHLVGFVAMINPDWAIYGAWPMATVTNIYFLLGLALQTTFFVLFLTLLSRADLSYVLPVTSFSYIITAVLAMLMLKEEVSGRRWFGILLICFGVLLVARGQARTDQKNGVNEVQEIADNAGNG
jgi:uncharacterized membrane protein